MLLPPDKQPGMLRKIRSSLLGNEREDIGRSYWSSYCPTPKSVIAFCHQVDTATVLPSIAFGRKVPSDWRFKSRD